MTDQRVHPDADRWGGWAWTEPQRGEHFRRCSFCGSIHPEDLAAEQFWAPNWADMKYGWPHKFYVDIPNRDPDALFVRGTSWGAAPPPPVNTSDQWVAVEDLTPEQRAIADRTGSLATAADGRGPRFVSFGPRAHHHGKFYTIHLSDTDLAPETKQKIEKRSGLMFTFRDGRVTWQPAPLL